MKPSIWVLRVASAPPAFVVSPRSVVRGVFCSVPHAEWLRQHWPLLLLPLLLLLRLDSLLHYRLVLLNILEKEAVKNMYVLEFNKLNLPTKIGKKIRLARREVYRSASVSRLLKRHTSEQIWSSPHSSTPSPPLPLAPENLFHVLTRARNPPSSPLLAPTHLPPATDTSSHR